MGIIQGSLEKLFQRKGDSGKHKFPDQRKKDLKDEQTRESNVACVRVNTTGEHSVTVCHECKRMMS